MIGEPYRTIKPYGEYFERMILKIREHIENNDDDYLLLMAGKTGTGKSTQGLHALDIYLSVEKLEQLKYNLVSQSKETFATNQHIISTSSKPRALIFDEANVSKRQAMTRFNNDLLDLYYANRGLNIFHIWCNPSMDIIDLPFIEERINGVLYFPESNKSARKVMIREEIDSFRHYYYFNKDDIKKIYLKEGKLTNDILHKHKKKCRFLGWFNKYRGCLKEVYLLGKDDRMKEKASTFRDRYGQDDLIDRGSVIKILGVNVNTVSKYMCKLQVEQDYVVTVSGRYKFTKVGIEHLKEAIIKGKRVQRVVGNV